MFPCLLTTVTNAPGEGDLGQGFNRLPKAFPRTHITSTLINTTKAISGQLAAQCAKAHGRQSFLLHASICKCTLFTNKP